jgi:hypothetical protein
MSTDNKPEETEGVISLESLIETVYAEFDYVVELHVGHHIPSSELTHLTITVPTTEAESCEEWLDVASASHVLITASNKISFCVPYSVMSTNFGPGHIQGDEGTTIYRSETVIGAEPREVSEGHRILQQKLNGRCPTCGEVAKNLNHHYRNQRTCAEAEMN